MKPIKFVLGSLALLLVAALAACSVQTAPATEAAVGPTVTPTPESAPATQPERPAQPPAPPQPPAGQGTESPAFDLSGELVPVAASGSYQFAEGPATDSWGNVYFSDIDAGRIYRWSTDGSVTVFLDGLDRPNGLAFDAGGNLVACEGGAGRLISIDPAGQITVLADGYNGTPFNEPNDLWIDAQGGIYFTDPAYTAPVVQDVEAVYYLSPDRSQVTRVIDDLVRPNGIVGSDDGTTLYVADHGAGQTYAYTIDAGGSLSDKRLFVASGSDGMELDAAGNLYITTQNQVQVYDAAGALLAGIPTQENPTNVTFTGANGGTLFITARTAVYTVSLSASVSAVEPGNVSTDGFILTSPEVVDGGLLPVDYTCDGVAATLPLAWSETPEGTQGYVVIMHHIAPDDAVHWYWVLYDLPADVTSLERNVSGIGTLGTNSVNDRTEYAPPCSQGPGPKEYIYTVYALSAQPQFSVPASQVTRAVMLEAIQDITLASAELHVTYSRQ